MNHVQTVSFDADGRTISVLDNLGHGPTYAYGHGGELLTTTDSLSHTSTNQYDSRYRLIQTTDANGGVTSITLDATGNRTALVDPANNQTTWVLDTLNRPTTETNALGTTTTGYDASSDVTTITDANGRVRNFQFDNLHRLTTEQWMNGQTVVATMAYAYDADNELTSASDPNSAYSFTFDGDGNTLTVDSSGTPNVPHVVLTNTFDAGGDRTSLSTTIAGVKDFLNTYSFDADQRLTTVTQQGQNGGNIVSPKEIDYAYNALGQFTSVVDYNTLTGPRTDVATGAYSYDTANRLTGLAYTSNVGASTIGTFGWGYNAANLVTSFTSIDGTASYGYDPTNQLTSATYTTASGGHQPANESYSFDLNGNRTMTGYSTGSVNLITSDGTFNYQHDADGNQTVRTRISSAYATDYQATYAWDYRNRLTDVQFFDNNSVLTKHVHYAYDVFNSLIATQVDSTGSGSYNITQHYVVDGGQPLLQFDNNLTLTERNLIAPNPAGVAAVVAQGAVSSLNQADVVTWMIDDKLGSPRDVENNSGSTVNHIVYSSFGQDAYESNSSITHWAGFGGGHDDIYTALTQNGRRWYDPSTGKWLSQDPISFLGGDADVSRYVGNSPTNGIDPTGLIDYGPDGDPGYYGNPEPVPQPTPSIGFQGTSGSVSPFSVMPPVTYGYGQPSNQTSGSFVTVGPATGVTSVAVTGPDVCNTCNQGGNPDVMAGCLTPYLLNYPSGTYTVTATYMVCVASTNPVTLPAAATVYVACPPGYPGSANGGIPGVPIYPKVPVALVNTGPMTPTVLAGGTVTAVVTVSGGVDTYVLTVVPVLAGQGSGTATFYTVVTIVNVAPYNPSQPYFPGMGGGF